MDVRKDCNHSPSQLFVPSCCYIVTAGTYRKAHLFDTPSKRDIVLQHLMTEAHRFGWELQAWAVLANHYHFVATAPTNPESLSKFLRSLHSKTAIETNRIDGSPGRKVWWQFWDTCITDERSYFARLHYVHQNPARHGLVEKAEDYQWCSMRWFLREGDNALRNTVFSFKIDKVVVRDDF